MKCPKCNIWNTDSAKFCRNCGSKFVICPKCGSDNIEDDETGYLQYTCGNCEHFWGHSGEECPKCGSDDTEDDNTGNLPYKCNVCGHNWGDETEEDEENDSTTTLTPTPSSDGVDTFFKVLGTIAVIGICIAIVVWTNGYGAPLGYGAYKAIQSIWD